MNDVNIVNAVGNTEISFQCTAVNAVHHVHKHEAWTTIKVSLVFNLRFILSFKVKIALEYFIVLNYINLLMQPFMLGNMTFESVSICLRYF